MRPEKLDHVALFASDPDRVAATMCARLPFRVPPATDRPLLNHVGLLVESLADVTGSVAEQGFHVTREVDAENSKAIFVRGPDGVELEYIEHKPSFVLA